MFKNLSVLIIILFCLSTIQLNAQKRQVREMSPFHGVKIATNIDAFLSEGTTEEVEIETDNLEWEWIKTEVNDGILKVYIDRDKPWQNMKHDTKIHITYKRMNYVKATSSGDISIQNDLEDESIFIGTSSSGDIKALDVKAEELQVATSSSGDIKIGKLEAEECTVKTSSSGDIYVNNIVSTDELKLSTSSSGDLKITDIQTETLYVSLSSSGDIHINGGNAQKSEMKASSSGDLYASKLNSGKVSARVSSSGTLRIGTASELNASISSSGDIIYQGETKIIDVRDNSSGDVRRGN